MAQEKSIFTKIIEGEIPAHKVYEDEKVLAFLDIRPASKGHTLVIPKEQVDHLDELEPELYGAVMDVVRRLSLKIKQTYKPQRVGLVVFGLDVPHAHVHLIPLYQGDEIAIKHTEADEVSQEELAQIAEQIKL